MPPGWWRSMQPVPLPADRHDRPFPAAAPPRRPARRGGRRSRHRGMLDVSLLDHLIGSGEERRRDCEPEGFGGLEVDDELEYGRLLDGEICRFRALQDLVHVASGAPGLLEEVRYIGHQTTLTSVVLVLEHRREPELNRRVQDPPAVKEEERIIQREERIGTLSRQGGQGSIELLNGFLDL